MLLLQGIVTCLTAASFAVAAVFFLPSQARAETELASWYGPGFEGLPTCSGETFDPDLFTAASLEYPYGTTLRVWYGDVYVEVWVNDCGPYVDGRTLDLSQAAAEYLGLTAVGVDYVEAYPLE